MRYQGADCTVAGFRGASGVRTGQCSSADASTGSGKAAKIRVGSHVTLAPGGLSIRDAGSGPLQPGDVGVVTEAKEGSCRVKAVTGRKPGREWFYGTKALRAKAQAGAKAVCTKPWGRPEHEHAWKLAQLMAAQGAIVGLHAVHEHIRRRFALPHPYTDLIPTLTFTLHCYLVTRIPTLPNP